jgi:hypothetical protein
MSRTVSSRPDISIRPPFFGVDRLYRPPVQEGVEVPPHLPSHLELPEENGEIVENFREAPQGHLLDEGIWPILEQIHPDRHFAIGHDCGIYWLLANPPERGAICPDWFYVAGVPPLLDDHYRRSYVLWKEHVAPTLLIEFVSGDGRKERDQTPREGKFWIYENAVQGRFYAIFIVETGDLEVFRLDDGKYRRLEADHRGQYIIDPLGAKLGVWRGLYYSETAPWLRWYDINGKLLPTDKDRARAERRRADVEHSRAEDERSRAEEERSRANEAVLRAEEERSRAKEAVLSADDERLRAEDAHRRSEKLAEKLRELGIDPDLP